MPTPEIEKQSLDHLPLVSPKLENVSQVPETISRKPASSEKESKREPAFKRIRVSEIRHMIGDKVKSFRRRESNEQFDLDSNLSKADSGRNSPEQLSTEESPSRPMSSLGKLQESEDNSCTEVSGNLQEGEGNSSAQVSGKLQDSGDSSC